MNFYVPYVKCEFCGEKERRDPVDNICQDCQRVQNDLPKVFKWVNKVVEYRIKEALKGQENLANWDRSAEE
jgi:hypothetical protein